MLLPRERNLHIAVILLAALVVYANTLANGFVYDDLMQILENRWLQDPSNIVEIFTSHVWGFSEQHPLTNYYRPLMHTANLLVYTLFGPNPFYYHLVSLLLHLGCCVLLYLVTAELCRSLYPDDASLERNLPLLGALFFAVYPANSEAVAWLGSSGDLLCALFILGSLNFYLLKVRTGRLSFQAYSVLAFACALLSKETAVLTVPLLLFMADLTAGHLSSGRGWRSACWRYAPYAVVGVAYLAIRISVLGALIPLKKYTLDGFLLFVSAGQKFLWYVGGLVWPFTQSIYPELKSPATLSGGEIALGAFLFVLTLGALGYLAWENRVLRVMSVLIAVPLFSAMQAHVLRDPVAYRYLYMPAMGFCLILAWLVVRCVRSRKARIGLVVLLSLVWGATAFTLNRNFLDGVTAWGEAVKQAPRSVVARSWYAKELFDSGRTEEGITQAKKILELGSDDPGNIYKLAEGLQKLGRLREAQSYYQQLTQMVPGDAWVHAQLGRVCLGLGENGCAVDSLARAARLDSGQGIFQYWLGVAYEKNGQLALAQAAYQEAERLLPADAPERTAIRQKSAMGKRVGE